MVNKEPLTRCKESGASFVLVPVRELGRDTEKEVSIVDLCITSKPIFPRLILVMRNHVGELTLSPGCIDIPVSRKRLISILSELNSCPLFCDVDGGDLTVASDTPCLPQNNTCELIGALGQGCGAVAVASRSWAGIKSLYR